MFISKKILIATLFTAIITTAPGIQASITTRLFGSLEQAQLGMEQASQCYQDKAHEFLNYFGVKDAENVGIYKINWALHPEYRILPAFAARSGIWLNETIFDKSTEQEQLWIIAHETAHYAHSHAWRKFGVETGSKFFSATSAIVVGAVFVWRLKHYDELNTKALWQNMLTGAFLGFMGGTTAITQYLNLRPGINGYAKELEIEADLKAAQMLCINGYASTVEAHVQNLSNMIAKGMVTVNIQDHPSLEESLQYMQAFWDAYTQALKSNQTDNTEPALS